ncbi:MAG: imidazoleglycerol-phosphate dehydratase HisB [Gemmatimonadetes bacterium]|nr:imidazoleglycerol-phosphate dehydratase HisB [Gemmatimonadota bacterium]
MGREIVRSRKTRETNVHCRLRIDGEGRASVKTGIGFWDHMLETIAKHALWDLELTADGDLVVDDHHTVEDTGIVLGQAIREALGERTRIARFGSAYAPLDEALSRAVIDLVDRPGASVSFLFTRERIGAWSTETGAHFFETLAVQAGFTLHLDTLKGENDHHRIESACKAFALAFRAATAVDSRVEVASTKARMRS